MEHLLVCPAMKVKMWPNARLPRSKFANRRRRWLAGWSTCHTSIDFMPDMKLLNIRGRTNPDAGSGMQGESA